MSSRPRRLAALGVGLALAAGPARADDAEDATCRNGLFLAENAPVGLGTIKGPGGAALVDSLTGCPPGAGYCRRPAPVSAGAQVLTGRIRGTLVCILRPDQRGGEAGWAPLARVARRPQTHPPLSAWRGWWRDGQEVVLLDPKAAGQLMVSGRARWPGRISPHFGEITAMAKPEGDRLRAWGDDVRGEDSCRVDFTLLGDFLLASDTGNCGGANVSFTGVYRRFTPKSPRKPPQ